MKCNEEPISVGEFLDLFQQSLRQRGITKTLSFSAQARSAQLEKRIAAGILHEGMSSLHLEEEEEDWEAALVLKDLFICHTCVRPVAQIFVKGIIEASSNNCFGMEEFVNLEQAKQILDRFWNKQIRILPRKHESKPFRQIHQKDAERILAENAIRILVDVRERQDYEADEKASGRVNIPLRSLQQNPYQLGNDRMTAIFLYCRGGYLATLAAKLLVEHGYQNVTAVLP